MIEVNMLNAYIQTVDFSYWISIAKLFLIHGLKNIVHFFCAISDMEILRFIKLIVLSMGVTLVASI